MLKNGAKESGENNRKTAFPKHRKLAVNYKLCFIKTKNIYTNLSTGDLNT